MQFPVYFTPQRRGVYYTNLYRSVKTCEKNPKVFLLACLWACGKASICVLIFWNFCCSSSSSFAKALLIPVSSLLAPRTIACILVLRSSLFLVIFFCSSFFCCFFIIWSASANDFCSFSKSPLIPECKHGLHRCRQSGAGSGAVRRLRSVHASLALSIKPSR